MEPDKPVRQQDWTEQEWAVIQAAKLAEIAAHHRPTSTEVGGMNTGYCAECDQVYPCPTYRMAAGFIDPFSQEWDSSDEYLEGEPDEGPDIRTWSPLTELLAIRHGISRRQ